MLVLRRRECRKPNNKRFKTASLTACKPARRHGTSTLARGKGSYHPYLDSASVAF
ncbi:hypothetical protein QWZ16_23315 [Vibrio ostreicida]|uniref:Acetyltransferase n=1 Tax=Vibrio ostreicida TaxID=526588 RepID=A0ABT8C2G3_9VIBR|nr:hypothetical protein [Vibrio ostreicida]MDN3612532.1 hypothetical protein [Vibrio ostreicida]